MSSAQLDLSTRTIKIFKSAFDATARSNITAHVADNDNPHTVTKAQVGLSLVDNTADADKPISTAAAAALAAKAPLASPALTGVPTAPTAAPGTANTQVATTAYADAAANVADAAAAAVAADLATHEASVANPHAVTKAQVGLANADNTSDANKPISSATQTALNAGTAATAAVAADLATHEADDANPHAVTAAQLGLGAVDNTADVDKPVSDATQIALNQKAPLASPTLTGTPAAPTAAPGTNTTQLATTAFVKAAADVVSGDTATALALKAPLASPTLTGTPAAPTAAPGTNTTQLSTTAFVTAAAAVVAGDAATALALKAPLVSPALTGVPTVPTAAPGTNTTQAASTAFTTGAVAVAQADATQALADALPVSSLFAQLLDRPGDGVRLYGETTTGAPSAATLINPAWIAVSDAGVVVRVDGAAADDPQVVAPAAAFPIEAGRVYDVRYKVQRQTDPIDPLNDSVTLAIRWLDEDKAGMPGGGGTATVEDIPLEVVDGVQERIVRIALVAAPAGYDVNHLAPAGTVYFRPYVELYGNSHVTDVIVVSVVPSPPRQDVFNLKNYLAVGDGSDESSSMAAFLSGLAAAYAPGTPPNVVGSARAAYIPSGLFDAAPVAATAIVAGLRYTIATVGDTDWLAIGATSDTVGTNFTATGAGTGTGTASLILGPNVFGFSMFGDGRVSQLQDITVEANSNLVRMGNFAIIGAPGSPTGVGLALRAVQFLGYGIDIYNKDIALDNSNDPAVDGGLVSNNTVIGGQYRGGRIGINSAAIDLRAAFIRGSDFTVCGIDRWDGAGNVFAFNNIGTNTGPSMRMRGKVFTFTGDTTTGSPTISDVSDFSQIEVGDVIGAVAGNFSRNTIIKSFDQVASTITIAPPALQDSTALSITILQVPVEDFWVANTLNTGRTDKLAFGIQSIVEEPGVGIRVTLNENYFGLSLGDDRIDLSGTGIASYDTPATLTDKYILQIISWRVLILSYEYDGDAATGTLSAFNFDVEIHSAGGQNAFVRDQFFTGNNINKILFQGGADFNFFGTRLKEKMWFDGVRPFLGTTTLGSAQITGIDSSIFDTDELRRGVPLVPNLGGFAHNPVFVIQVDSATEVTVGYYDEDGDLVPALATATNPSVLFKSPYTPNNIFHVAPVDSSTIEQTGVTTPSGPGSTMGWATLAMFPVGLADTYAAAEGSYLAGIACPYTAGGMLNGSVRFKNKVGVMNTGFHIESNSIGHFLQGAVWKSELNQLSLDEYDVNVGGIVGSKLGADVSFYIRAYRSTNGNTYGNAIQQFASPRNNTAAGASVTAAYIVAPGNNIDNQASIFIGASNSGAPDLTGPRGQLRTLSGNIELNTNQRLSGWKGSSSFTIIAASWAATNGGEITYTTSAPHGQGVGVLLYASGNTPAAYNGEYTTITGTTGSTVVVAKTVDPGAAVVLGSMTFALEWMRLSGDVAAGGNSFVIEDVNNIKRFSVANPNTGTLATAALSALQTATQSTTGVHMQVYGTGFTPTGTHDLADGAAVYSGTALSAGLTLASLAGELRLRAAGDMKLFGGSTQMVTLASDGSAITLGAALRGLATVGLTNTPANNNEWTLSAPNNTTLVFRLKGNDGVVRASSAITLS